MTRLSEIVQKKKTAQDELFQICLGEWGVLSRSNKAGIVYWFCIFLTTLNLQLTTFSLVSSQLLTSN